MIFGGHLGLGYTVKGIRNGAARNGISQYGDRHKGPGMIELIPMTFHRCLLYFHKSFQS